MTTVRAKKSTAKTTARKPLRLSPSQSRQSNEARLPAGAVSSAQQMETQREHALTREAGNGAHNLVGMIHAETGQYRLLSKDEERSVARAARAGDGQAREALILANLRLVTSFAKYYNGRGVEHPDLIQEGYLGLMKAAELYDPETGYAFSTYAVQWVRQAMQRAVMDKGRMIRVPVYMRERQTQLLRLAAQIEKQEGRAATLEELAEQTRENASRFRDRTLTPQQVREALYGVPLEPRSFSEVLVETHLLHGTDLELEGFIPDHAAADALEAVEERIDHELAAQAPDSVTQIIRRLRKRRPELGRALDIVERRALALGEDQTNVTLTAIGRELGISHERVRQLELKGLQAIRDERARVQARMGRSEKGGAA